MATHAFPDLHRRLLRIRRPRLLVVEDDLELWRLIERAVRAASPDASIHWAADADSARLALERYSFDAVIADFLLSDSTNGWSVLRLSRQLQPAARLAMASALPLRPPEADGVPFLRKPFDLEGCREFVSRLLDS